MVLTITRFERTHSFLAPFIRRQRLRDLALKFMTKTYLPFDIHYILITFTWHVVHYPNKLNYALLTLRTTY